MLTDQPAHVLTVRSGLAAKTRRVRRVVDRQVAPVENFAAVQVRQRNLRGWNQIQIPLAGNLEEILLELGQLARAGQRRTVGQKRRLDFAIPVLASVHVEHEVDERARQARTRAGKHREPRTGQARPALEIENAQCRAEVPVRLRDEIERARLSIAPDFDVVGRARADRDARMRQIRQRQRQ